MYNQQIEGFESRLLYLCNLYIENEDVHWNSVFSIIKQRVTSVRHRRHMEIICNLLTDYLLQYDCKDTTVALKIIEIYKRWCKWKMYKLQLMNKSTAEFILEPLCLHDVRKYKCPLPIKLHSMEIHETSRLTGDAKLSVILMRYEWLIPRGKRDATRDIPNEIQDFEATLLKFCESCTEMEDPESISWNSIFSFIKEHENIILHAIEVATICNLLADYLLINECSDKVVVVKVIESYNRWRRWKLHEIKKMQKGSIDFILKPLFPQGEQIYESTPLVILVNFEVYDTARRAKDVKFYELLSKYRMLIPDGSTQVMFTVNHSGLVE